MLTLLIFLCIAISVSAICSIFEATLFSLSTTDIAKISEKKPRAAKEWRIFRDNVKAPIAVILIINTLSISIGATIAGAKFESLFGHDWIGVYSIVFSFVMIQWAEILPKTLALRHRRYLGGILALPLKFLVKIFHPVLLFIELINRPFEGKNEKRITEDSLAEIDILAKFSSLNNLINDDQKHIISQSIRLQNIKVGDIMIKRSEIKFLSTTMSLMDALIEAHLHHHTRFPLIEGKNLDNVIGYINFKDIVNALRINPKDPSLKGIARPIVFINPNENLKNLLSKLTKGYQHIGVIKNDNGKTEGLITLEDLFEFMIGDIQDEYDILPTHVLKITEERYLAGGGIKLHDLKKAVGENILEEDISLNEWFTKQIGKIPKVEDILLYNNIRYTVRTIRRSKLFEAIIEIIK